MTGYRRTKQVGDQAQLSPAKLAELHTRFGGALERYFLRRGCPADTAEDLVQNVFLRLAARQATTQIDNIDAYLMQTASSVWTDHGRWRRSRAEGAHIEYEDLLHGHGDFSPERIYEARQALDRVLASLKALSVRARQVFLLRRFEGMSQKEVAERLGISVSLVEKEMMKAIAHITDSLGDQ